MASYRIITGDVKQVLQNMGEATFDACFCDPPYGLNFMNQTWDHGVPPADVWQEVLRVLKPGAFLLAFGGTRTQHRLTCAIEDAGFEIRDCIMWIYGSGWPKSLDISKAIDKAAGVKREIIGPNPNAIGSHKEDRASVDVRTSSATAAAKQWEGYGSAIKPAYEPCIVAMKPLDGTFAQNALKHGVAGLNIDACRITTDENLNGGAYANNGTDRHDGTENWRYKRDGGAGEYNQPIGRWPANLIHDDSEEVLNLFPITKSGTTSPQHKLNVARFGCGKLYGDWKPKLLALRVFPANEGSASRFFYCAKASRRERGEENNHPCVKPVALCRYLAKLLLPPKRDTPRTILVPFSGSGSEIIGALLAGWDKVVGIEIASEWVTIAKTRLASYSSRRKVSEGS